MSSTIRWVKGSLEHRFSVFDNQLEYANPWGPLKAPRCLKAPLFKSAMIAVLRLMRRINAKLLELSVNGVTTDP